MTLRLSNEFHHTTARVCVTGSQALSRRTTQRVQRQLCGVAGCTCGDILGTRGIQRAGDATVLVMPMPDGRAFLEIIKN